MPTTAYTMAGEWNDSQAPALGLRVGGTAPTFSSVIGNVYSYFFNTSDEAHGSVQLSHSYIAGTTLKPHVHFTFATAPTVGQTVQWSLEYVTAPINGVFSAATTTIMADYSIVVGDLRKHIALSLPDIPGTGLGHSSMILFRIYRSGGTSAVNPALLSFDIHFQQGNYGTETEF